MQHIEKTENMIPIVVNSRQHEWRKAFIVGTFMLLTSSLLLYIFTSATAQTEHETESNCYSDGVQPYPKSQAGTTDVTAQFEMLTKFGQAICSIYIIVGVCVCVKPLFCCSQLLAHLNNFLYFVYMITLSVVMDSSTTAPCCDVNNITPLNNYLPIKECAFLNGIKYVGWIFPVIICITSAVAASCNHKEIKEQYEKLNAGEVTIVE